MDDPAFKKAVGSPNGAIDRLYEYYYEMAGDDTGEDRCICVVADAPYGGILGIYPCNAETIYYEEPIWEAEEKNKE